MTEKQTIELRRCTRCGHASVNHVCSDVREAIERAEVQRKNIAALSQLMGQYNFQIPSKVFKLWRPTKRNRGQVLGVHEGLEIVATDGILGWFITFEGVAWQGHIGHFTGKVETLYRSDGPMSSKTKVKQPKKLSKRQQILLTT